MPVTDVEVFSRDMPVPGVVLNPAPGVNDLYTPVVPKTVMYDLEVSAENSLVRWANFQLTAVVPFFGAAGVPVFLSSQSILYALGAGSLSFLGLTALCAWLGISSFKRKYPSSHDLFEVNKKAFIAWLRVRYGITCEFGVEDSDWLRNVVCFGDLSSRRTFRDVNGKQFQLKNGPDGLFVTAVVSDGQEFLGSGESGETLLLEVSDVLTDEARILCLTVEQKLCIVSGLKLDAVSEHVVARVKQDLMEFSQTVRALHGLDSLSSEDDIICGVLAGLNDDLQRVIDGCAGELKRKLAGQFEWVKSRQLGAVSLKSDSLELHVVEEFL